jgi:NitT/TauT family transport system substrate-binding protein
MKMSTLKYAAMALTILTLAVSGASAEDYDIKVVTPETPPSFDNLYLQVAYEKGIFKKNGLNVTSFIQLKGGPLATTAVVSGQADLTATDVEGIIQATKAGYPVRAVSAPSNKLSYIVAVSKDIKSFQDLKGQSFAVSRAGALSQYVVFPFLQRENISRSDIKWLSVGSSKDRLGALLAKRVKAAVLYIDNAAEVRDNPEVTTLANIADLLPFYPHELLLVRKDDIDNKPEKVTRMVQSIIEACRFLVEHRNESIDIFIKYTGADRAVAEYTYDKLIPMKPWGVNGGMTEQTIKGAMQTSLENKALDAPIPVENLADFRFQAEALRRLGGPVPE